MQIETSYRVTEWLSAEQLLLLLERGELLIAGPTGGLRLYVHSIDRVTTAEWAKHFPFQHNSNLHPKEKV